LIIDNATNELTLSPKPVGLGVAKPLAEAKRHAAAMAMLENFIFGLYIKGREPFGKFVVTAITRKRRTIIFDFRGLFQLYFTTYVEGN
jgi:hypothetical protein